MTMMMNDWDMDVMLSSICPDGESYRGMAWGTLMSGTAEMLSSGALSNVYCYAGVTDRTLVVAVLDTFDISNLRGAISIPFDAVEKLKIKKGLVPSQRIIKLTSGNTKLKLSLVNNTITARVMEQKEGMRTICEVLNGVSHAH